MVILHKVLSYLDASEYRVSLCVLVFFFLNCTIKGVLCPHAVHCALILTEKMHLNHQTGGLRP